MARSGVSGPAGYRGAITAARFGDPQAELSALRSACCLSALGANHSPFTQPRNASTAWFCVTLNGRTPCGRIDFFDDAVATIPVPQNGHVAAVVFGGSVGWGGQARDDHAVPLGLAVAKLWPQTVLGWGCLITLTLGAPVAIPYALLIAGGLAFAVPLCVVTANRAVGAALLRAGIGRLPEETAPSPLDALPLPALKMIRRRDKEP